jgi:hypothetical protein
MSVSKINLFLIISIPLAAANGMIIPTTNLLK